MFDFKSLPEFSKLFPDEQACIAFLEKKGGEITLFLLLIRNLRCINAKEIDTSVKIRVNISMFVQERFLKIRKSHYENGCWLVILLLK